LFAFRDPNVEGKFGSVAGEEIAGHPILGEIYGMSRLLRAIENQSPFRFALVSDMDFLFLQMPILEMDDQFLIPLTIGLHI